MSYYVVKSGLGGTLESATPKMSVIAAVTFLSLQIPLTFFFSLKLIFNYCLVAVKLIYRFFFCFLSRSGEQMVRYSNCSAEFHPRSYKNNDVKVLNNLDTANNL